MTGFGVGGATLGAGRLSVEARSVNHRFLDVRVRLPPELSEHGFFVEQLVRARISRGRFDVAVQRTEAHSEFFDPDRARAAYEALRKLRDDVAPGTPLPLTVLSLVPDLFAAGGSFDANAARAALEEGTTRALGALDEMRAAEGRVLAEELGKRADAVEALAGSIASASEGSPKAHADKLRARIASLLPSAGVTADPGRLEMEIALIADRLDITEEIVRLESHARQFRRVLGSDEPAGRKLDFLLQEMGREANTVGAKCQDASLAHQVVELKAELSRMREQVQNVE